MIRYPNNENNYLEENKSFRNVFWPYPLVTIDELDLTSSEYQFIVKSDKDINEFFLENELQDNVKIVLPKEFLKETHAISNKNIYYFCIEDSREVVPDKEYSLDSCTNESRLIKSLSGFVASYSENFMCKGLNLFLLLGIHKLCYFSNFDESVATLPKRQTVPLTPFHSLHIISP
jgi:hypothetical protein